MKTITLPASVDRLDERVEQFVRPYRGRRLDGPAHLLSSAADRSRVWLVIGAAQVYRGRRGNTVHSPVPPIAGILVVGLESAIVHAFLKRAFQRQRPDALV